jgi:hypothetical protein
MASRPFLPKVLYKPRGRFSDFQPSWSVTVAGLCRSYTGLAHLSRAMIARHPEAVNVMHLSRRSIHYWWGSHSAVRSRPANKFADGLWLMCEGDEKGSASR